MHLSMMVGFVLRAFTWPKWLSPPMQSPLKEKLRLFIAQRHRSDDPAALAGVFAAGPTFRLSGARPEVEEAMLLVLTRALREIRSPEDLEARLQEAAQSLGRSWFEQKGIPSDVHWLSDPQAHLVRLLRLALTHAGW